MSFPTQSSYGKDYQKVLELSLEDQIEKLQKDYSLLSQQVRKIPKSLAEEQKRTQKFKSFKKNKKKLDKDTGGMTKFLDGKQKSKFFVKESAFRIP